MGNPCVLTDTDHLISQFCGVLPWSKEQRKLCSTVFGSYSKQVKLKRWRTTSDRTNEAGNAGNEWTCRLWNQHAQLKYNGLKHTNESLMSYTVSRPWWCLCKHQTLFMQNPFRPMMWSQWPGHGVGLQDILCWHMYWMDYFVATAPNSKLSVLQAFGLLWVIASHPQMLTNSLSTLRHNDSLATLCCVLCEFASLLSDQATQSAKHKLPLYWSQTSLWRALAHACAPLLALILLNDIDDLNTEPKISWMYATVYLETSVIIKLVPIESDVKIALEESNLCVCSGRGGGVRGGGNKRGPNGSSWTPTFAQL